MSDKGLGSGWRQESDGRWYPPESHSGHDALRPAAGPPILEGHQVRAGDTHQQEVRHVSWRWARRAGVFLVGAIAGSIVRILVACVFGYLHKLATPSASARILRVAHVEGQGRKFDVTYRTSNLPSGDYTWVVVQIDNNSYPEGSNPLCESNCSVLAMIGNANDHVGTTYSVRIVEVGIAGQAAFDDYEIQQLTSTTPWGVPIPASTFQLANVHFIETQMESATVKEPGTVSAFQ